MDRIERGRHEVCNNLSNTHYAITEVDPINTSRIIYLLSIQSRPLSARRLVASSVMFFSFFFIFNENRPESIRHSVCLQKTNQYAAMTRSVGIDFQCDTFPLSQKPREHQWRRLIHGSSASLTTTTRNCIAFSAWFTTNPS